MTMFIQNDATGAGAGSLAPNQAFVDLTVIANGDTGLGLAAQVGNRQQVTYARTDNGIPATRLGNLVNTNFTPDYGLGAGPQAVNIIVLPVLANFTLNDGTMITNIAGTALAPSNSGLGGAGLNNTNDCLVIYDTSQSNGNGYCTARAGTGGTLDLAFPNSVILYHELSHALRIVNNALLALTAGCNPSSPEENAAITDENDLRTQNANAAGTTPVLRDPGIHCGSSGPCATNGGCCIVATVASGSTLSAEVAALRSVRDGLLRKSEVGFSFFQSLYHDYYGFSPQVCTLMARHPELRPFVLEGLVRPLVYILRLIEEYALRGGTAATLSKQFVDDHADREAAVERLSILFQAREVLAGSNTELNDVQLELAHLLVPALSSEHVIWALVEPIQIYESALRAHLDECSADQLGEQLYETINGWAGRMPLDDVWAVLTVEELGNELHALDSTLLHTEKARASFRDRLNREFCDITAVTTVHNEQTFRSGENQ
ncbi:MAG: CFI-box-CTERM domain-containing protein [Pyrinomonadaceae bacterium]